MAIPPASRRMAPTDWQATVTISSSDAMIHGGTRPIRPERHPPASHSQAARSAAPAIHMPS